MMRGRGSFSFQHAHKDLFSCDGKFMHIDDINGNAYPLQTLKRNVNVYFSKGCTAINTYF